MQSRRRQKTTPILQPMDLVVEISVLLKCLDANIQNLLFVALIFYFISSSTSREFVLDLYNQNASSIELNTRSICKCKAKITRLNVYNSSLTVLPSRFLKNCIGLDDLNLSGNKIVEVKHDTFENLTDLNGLDLSFNQLTILPKVLFKSLVNLLSLKLQGNQIQIVDSDLFFHNIYLYTLYINNNSLNVIQPKSFRNNLYLSNLHVNDNRNLSNIDLFPEDRETLELLELSNCGFSQLYIPKNVEEIDASFNEINSVTAHPESVLKNLKIDHNSLANLARLPRLDKLKLLIIPINAIEFFDFHDLSRFKNIRLLSIDLNPKQNISAADIKTILPLLSDLYINSPGISIENKKRIWYDFKRNGISVVINFDRSIERYFDENTEDEEEC
ncbi:toll-like receptor 2 [Contarinia nasturtii]|uniref:toll-like receptor 2 n=1 Tax=Contarinia nasturtii TaxID=265458 RepID=UPI0012D43990|nr:toll-like receptor 2 [Contarinia nasturtii]